MKLITEPGVTPRSTGTGGASTNQSISFPENTAGSLNRARKLVILIDTPCTLIPHVPG